MRLGRALFAVLGLMAAAAATAQEARFFRIATGTTGGTYFPIGGVIANAISSPPGARPCDRGGSCGVPGLIAVAQATSGSLENIELLRDGRIESGLTQADIAYFAETATGPYAGQPRFTELRAIGSLYAEQMHIVVRRDSGILGLADLAGKRVSVGEEGSGTIVEARAILKAAGLDEKADLTPHYLRPGPAADKLVGGEIDAFFIIGGPPVQAVSQAAARIPVRLLPIEGAAATALVRAQPFLTAAEIPADAYPGQDAPTPTVGVVAQWVTTSAVDADLVYAMTRALWNESTARLLSGSHPQGRNIQLAGALRGIAIPLHEGARRFYAEQGMSLGPPTGSGSHAATDGERPAERADGRDVP
ncbi:MAG TPA: TAXI family TRAP transporter solute-binding subunit [Alphaproteobacteria bacterium]|nr:TAXI family TRAP transporter solute-binding subunit [Alphaproteobacteria bacterium]